MTDFCLHKSTLGQFTKQLFELISTGKRYRIKSPNGETSEQFQ